MRRNWEIRRVVIAAVVLTGVMQAGQPSLATLTLPGLVQAAEEWPATAPNLPNATWASELAGDSLQSEQSALRVASRAGLRESDLAASPPLEAQSSSETSWRGTAGQEAYMRAAPSRSAARVGTLAAGQSVEVVRWVSGDQVEPDNSTWADLGGRYVFSTLLRSQPLGGPPPPTAAPRRGRWIDVNLTLQAATAYEGAGPVRSVRISTGRPGWETPRGLFTVQRRVENETMDGTTLLGQGPRGEGASYKVEHVRWTQYFTPDGSAIHENYWRNPATFGMPGSHGCIGMASADAAWFWDFAQIGTPLVIH